MHTCTHMHTCMPPGSLGRHQADMLALLADLMPLVPDDKPNHLLGIGDETSVDVCMCMCACAWVHVHRCVCMGACA